MSETKHVRYMGPIDEVTLVDLGLRCPRAEWVTVPAETAAGLAAPTWEVEAPAAPNVPPAAVNVPSAPTTDGEAL